MFTLNLESSCLSVLSTRHVPPFGDLPASASQGTLGFSFILFSSLFYIYLFLLCLCVW